MSDIRRYKIEVTGRVQGVGYRAFVLRVAESMEITGFAKNQYDGSVLIEAEGSVDKLQLFIDRCKAGPGWAHVSGVQVNELPIENSVLFKISR
ncbi:MAG: acylphosphatase [Cyclobacteriaceae bacterium]|nr:acylphosphatase [Cyclobacteriaceae bacterium]